MDESKPRRAHRTPPCVLCGDAHASNHRMRCEILRLPIQEMLRAKLPDGAIPKDATLCRNCLGELRMQHTLDRLSEERGILTDLERQVAEKAASHATVATDLESSLDREATFGQRVADSVARVGGSWSFVLGFVGFLVAWMIVNVAFLTDDAYDPYPFILLNLVLSCIAALQAPIIMMSQNRSAARDRRAAELDFRVNLKAELEIAALHEKIDHLVEARQEDLLALESLQLELLAELSKHRPAHAPGEPSR